MNLHNDKDAFRALLLDIERKAGIRSDIIEKDYCLTNFEQELNNSFPICDFFIVNGFPGQESIK